MQIDTIESGFLSIFLLITFFVFLIISKYSHKLINGILLDKDFSKPQAFHNEAVSRSGGLASLISLFIFFLINYALFSKIFYEYVLIGTSLFFLGYLDDIKIKIRPTTRLIYMIISLIILINFLPIEINNIDLIFLNEWLEIKFISIMFVLLCFLFIVNGSNLIDGFNGLLAINLIIINSILLFINLNNEQVEFSIFLTAQIIILITFLMFNFPKAKIFFGDSGSYLFGSLIALNVIFTNNFSPDISSFFFCILLFYLFFEVFFSFIRKLYQKKSPFLPDQFHLHMLCYKKIFNIFGRKNSNYMTSIIVNASFLIFITPSIFFAESTLFCKYWFFLLIIIYLIIYLYFKKTLKSQA